MCENTTLKHRYLLCTGRCTKCIICINSIIHEILFFLSAWKHSKVCRVRILDILPRTNIFDTAIFDVFFWKNTQFHFQPTVYRRPAPKYVCYKGLIWILRLHPSPHPTQSVSDLCNLQGCRTIFFLPIANLKLSNFAGEKNFLLDLCQIQQIRDICTILH